MGQQTIGMSSTIGQGEIKQIGVLDLTGLTDAGELERVTAISEVGVILVPESLAGKLAHIAMEKVGAVVSIPTGEHVKVQVGPVRLTGEALAAPGHEEGTLVLIGPVLISTVVEQLAYRSLIINGIVIAPRGSETALSRISRMNGPIVYYGGSQPRLFMSEDRLGKAFFDYLEGPITMIVLAKVTLEADVSAEVAKQKIAEIVVLGEIQAPAALVPLLQALATEKLGTISTLAEA